MVRRAVQALVILSLGLLSAVPAGGAQQPATVPRIGYLGISSPSLEPHYVEAFRQKLRDLGHTEGKSIVIEYRWAEGHYDRLPGLAAELVRLKVDVIVTTSTPGTLAATGATKSIPIVMASSGDPVESGFVTSLARPGGNVTGFSIQAPELEGKRLELLKEVVPRLSRVAVLWNPANPFVPLVFEQTRLAASKLRLTLEPAVEVRRVEDLEGAFAKIARARPQALAVVVDRVLLANRTRIVGFAASRRLPAMYGFREYVDAGGLMSYAPSNIELFRGAATYVDKILKGAKPADLPVQQPTRFELVINMKTARALGLTFPQTVLIRADQVIQ
jgi:putative ABC transport system substrate-binding protein